MRGKRAKYLRNFAKQITEGKMPWREMQTHDVTRPIMTPMFDDKGKRILLTSVTHVQTMIGACGKKIYRQLKRNAPKFIDQQNRAAAIAENPVT